MCHDIVQHTPRRSLREAGDPRGLSSVDLSTDQCFLQQPGGFGPQRLLLFDQCP